MEIRGRVFAIKAITELSEQSVKIEFPKSDVKAVGLKLQYKVSVSIPFFSASSNQPNSRAARRIVGLRV